MHNRVTVFLLTFSIIISLMLPISAALPSAEDMQLYDRIIRLHVIANSDSADDQALKLRVRDGILVSVSELLDGVSEKEEAKAILIDNLDKIEEVAKAVLSAEHSEYSVSVTLTKEHYPTREYEYITLPSGEYTSLQVLIGEADGQNWWCVLFPKMCITATKSVGASDTGALIEAGLTPSQVRIITGSSPDVVIKFRFIELLSKLFS